MEEKYIALIRWILILTSSPMSEINFVIEIVTMRHSYLLWVTSGITNYKSLTAFAGTISANDIRRVIYE